jgi:hypothetical protein
MDSRQADAATHLFEPLLVPTGAEKSESWFLWILQLWHSPRYTVSHD